MELIEVILSKENLNRAYKKVVANKGASGVDGVTVEELGDYIRENREKIVTSLRNRTYIPKPVRRVYIPKDNGKKRPLGIPTALDRTIQQAIAQPISDIYEEIFSDYSYGFRSGRSCHDAIRQALEYLNDGYEWVVDIDIEQFFDKVNHDKLIQILREQVNDSTTLNLIRKYLKAGVMENGLEKATITGVPQGSLCRARHNTSKNATLCYSVIIKKERSQKLMNLEMITEGLKQLLQENNYSSATIRFYEGEWNKIQCFLTEEYGNTEYDMERGLKYLEKQYGFITKYNNGTLSQQRDQLLRVVHMLEDYRLHQVLTRRYYASKNPITLNAYYLNLYTDYLDFLNSTELSASTIGHYKGISRAFMDYLQQRKIGTIENITMDVCNSYLKTLAGYSFKTIEQNVCGIRHFLRFIYSIGILSTDYAEKIHMPAVSKSAKIPSAWKLDELKAMLSVIDRNSPIGKRDYAMILLACVLGLRIGDIKNLRFQNFNWEDKKLSLIQHKTHKPLTLPIPDAVGWAVIDYIKNGRPQYYESDQVFLKHMPPFDPIGNENHMQQQLVRYMRKAGIDQRTKKHSGFHSLRHSAGSMLLEMETPFPVITDILGHSDSDVTAVYLKTDLQKLAECVLSPEEFCHG